jgi:hypothetical protein
MCKDHDLYFNPCYRIQNNFLQPRQLSAFGISLNRVPALNHFLFLTTGFSISNMPYLNTSFLSFSRHMLIKCKLQNALKTCETFMSGNGDLSGA